jgi:hypothetical protein
MSDIRYLQGQQICLIRSRAAHELGELYAVVGGHHLRRLSPTQKLFAFTLKQSQLLQ